jgi:hypothetical protein
MCQNLASPEFARVYASIEAALDRWKWDMIRAMFVATTLQTILDVEITWLLMPQGRYHHHCPETHSVATPHKPPAPQHSTS